VRVGFTLQPDEEFLEHCAPLVLHDVDYYEVAPETLWRATPDGALEPNGFHRLFADLGEATKRPFVAHGVGFSMGSVGADEQRRRRRWLERIRQDNEVFQFRWYTDHLGATSLDGLALTLPIALPMTAESAQNVRRRLGQLQTVVADVGVENTAAYFLLGDPLDEPAFLKRVLSGPRTHLLLDLHNVFVMAGNMGFEPERYLERLDLDRVIEIHLSGGSDSSPAWLASGLTLRLDGHDAEVPAAVWALFDAYVGRCRNLRGVTLERMEGTVRAFDVPLLRQEIRRIRSALRQRCGVAA
jgi:uncharacterized protein (UPF0276 family)